MFSFGPQTALGAWHGAEPFGRDVFEEMEATMQVRLPQHDEGGHCSGLMRTLPVQAMQHDLAATFRAGRLLGSTPALSGSARSEARLPFGPSASMTFSSSLVSTVGRDGRVITREQQVHHRAIGDVRRAPRACLAQLMSSNTLFRCSSLSRRSPRRGVRRGTRAQGTKVLPFSAAWAASREPSKSERGGTIDSPAIPDVPDAVLPGAGREIAPGEKRRWTPLRT